MIKPEQAKNLIEQEDAILLDVRTKQEYETGYIKGAILLPLVDLTENIEAVVADKEKKIIIYCRSGNRSKTAVKQLAKLGYNDVWDLGGIINWTYGIEK